MVEHEECLGGDRTQLDIGCDQMSEGMSAPDTLGILIAIHLHTLPPGHTACNPGYPQD